MRFTFLAAAACLSSALRPEKIKSGAGSKTAEIRDILSKVTKTKNLDMLKETTDAVGGILAEIGNATEHMSEADEDVLHFTILTFEDMIYGSLDDCHAENVFELEDAIHAIEQCNVDIAFRQSPQGDLGKIEIALSLKQIELNRLQGVVDEKTEINNTRWEELDRHMQLIAKPPACPGLPARTMNALDLYFEESLYVIWFAAQQTAYVVVRDAWVLASANLESAIEAYEIQLAVRNTEYCDWKIALEAACTAFDLCYAETNDAYTTLAQKVTGLMDERIKIKKSGDIIIHQIRFLLGEVADQESPPTDTAEYQIAFPAIPDVGVCDLAPLDADRWVPSVQCAEGFHLAPRGVNQCDFGAGVSSQDACEKAGSELLEILGQIPGRSIVVGSWTHVSVGCSLQSRGDWAIHYNTRASGGNNDGGYSPVCTGLPQFHLAPHGLNQCDFGAVVVTEELCDFYGEQLLGTLSQTPGRSSVRGSWGHVPVGCSLQSRGDWSIHFNRRTSGGNNDGGYSPVCTGAP